MIVLRLRVILSQALDAFAERIKALIGASIRALVFSGLPLIERWARPSGCALDAENARCHAVVIASREAADDVLSPIRASTGSAQARRSKPKPWNASRRSIDNLAPPPRSCCDPVSIEKGRT
jgi:hypothetical protein